jgi:hypothetical protein
MTAARTFFLAALNAVLIVAVFAAWEFFAQWTAGGPYDAGRCMHQASILYWGALVLPFVVSEPVRRMMKLEGAEYWFLVVFSIAAGVLGAMDMQNLAVTSWLLVCGGRV